MLDIGLYKKFRWAQRSRKVKKMALKWGIYGFRRKLIHSDMLFMLQCESVNGLLIALGNGNRGGGGYEKFC